MNQYSNDSAETTDTGLLHQTICLFTSEPLPVHTVHWGWPGWVLTGCNLKLNVCWLTTTLVTSTESYFIKQNQIHSYLNKLLYPTITMIQLHMSELHWLTYSDPKTLKNKTISYNTSKIKHTVTALTTIIIRTTFMVLSSWHNHCESSPSLDQYRPGSINYRWILRIYINGPVTGKCFLTWISARFYILVEKIRLIDVCIHLVPVLYKQPVKKDSGIIVKKKI